MALCNNFRLCYNDQTKWALQLIHSEKHSLYIYIQENSESSTAELSFDSDQVLIFKMLMLILNQIILLDWIFLQNLTIRRNRNVIDGKESAADWQDFKNKLHFGTKSTTNYSWKMKNNNTRWSK